MNYLYLILNIGSVIIPFLFSFHPKLKFYKVWKYFFPSVIITMILFIIWDVVFTKNGVWGFNASYYLRFRIFSLPFEEWLFFICIPYACVFTHDSLIKCFPKLELPKRIALPIAVILIMLFLSIALLNHDKWYTLINYSYAAILTLIITKTNLKLLQKFLITYIVILIPFFVVNGILTGSYITDEVVWYNNEENLGIRIGTIPIEDMTYTFTLILTTLYIMEYLEKTFTSTARQLPS